MRNDSSPVFTATRQKVVLGILLGTFLVAFLLLQTVSATHEEDHSFTVSGTVISTNGYPVADVLVEAVDITYENDSYTSGKTDRAGKFSLVMHIHDDQFGDTILIRAANITKDIIADFTLGDDETHRGVEGIEFIVSPDVGIEVVESPNEEPKSIPIQYIAMIVGVILVILLVAQQLLNRKATRDRKRSISRISGIGKSRLRDFKAAGIYSIDDLLDADPNEAAKKTGMDQKTIRVFQKKGRRLQGD